MDVILKISNWFEKVKAIKFHGKPVKTEPLINSTMLKIKENIKNELIIFFEFIIEKT